MRASGWRKLRAAAGGLVALNVAALAGLWALPMPPEEPLWPASEVRPLHSGSGARPEARTRGMAALDEILAVRLTEAARARGRDAAELLPDEEVRRAAVAAGDEDGEALSALLGAYAEGFSVLGLGLDGEEIAPD